MILMTQCPSVKTEVSVSPSSGPTHANVWLITWDGIVRKVRMRQIKKQQNAITKLLHQMLMDGWINVFYLFSDMNDVSDKTPVKFDGATFLRIRNKKRIM